MNRLKHAALGIGAVGAVVAGLATVAPADAKNITIRNKINFYFH